MITCPHCRQTLAEPVAAAGQTLACPLCGGHFQVANVRFDPYHEWLGISPREYPITLYRLLGLAPFEQDEAAINNAAERQLVFLRQMRTGPRGAAADDLIRQVSDARLLLLDPYKRAEYDAGLRAAWESDMRQRAAATQASSTPQQPVISAPASTMPIQELSPPATRPSSIRRPRRYHPGSRIAAHLFYWVLGGIVGIALAWWVLWNHFGIDAVPQLVKDIDHRIQQQFNPPP
jgi:curved DNA-binding protein CbpA